MTKVEKAMLRTLIFVSQHEKTASFPDDDLEMEEVYGKLEKGKLVDVNITTSDWWLTYEGERELSRLKGLTFQKKAVRGVVWLLGIVLSGVVLFLLNRFLEDWVA